MKHPVRAGTSLLAIPLLVASVVLMSGCASDPLAEEFATTDQNYVSGNGSITLIAAAERGESVAWAGESDTGATLSSEDYLGEVVVLNFWYAACPPCRVEAPDLEALNQLFADEGATFIGVNVRDQAETALTFAVEAGVTFPSIIDTNDGNLLLAFAGTVAPNAVPTTLVIDKQGRVAARFLGAIDGQSTLKTIIRETIAEVG
ncbi:MAG: TlpA family protein disulfide reductase [Microbacteriaceae bacterium]